MFTVVTLALLFLTPPLFTAAGYRFVQNRTESMPKGIYFVSPVGKVERGMTMLLSLSPKQRQLLSRYPWGQANVPLLKQIVAIPGDLACFDSKLSVNGHEIAAIEASDKLGNPFPRLTGCSRLEKSQFLPLATKSPYSFDGRYFGPIEQDQIIGEASLVISFEDR